MNIIFVTNEFETENDSPGGLSSFTANIARLFYMNGHKVRIFLVTTKEVPITFDKGIIVENIFLKKSDWEKIRNVAEMYNIDNKAAANANRGQMVYLAKARQVRDRIVEINRAEKIDMVHFCNHGAFSLFMDNEIPYVVRISGFLNIIGGGADTPNGSLKFEDNPVSLREQIDNMALQQAKYVISPSQLLADIALKTLNVNARVIESPFLLTESKWDWELFRNTLEKKKYILYYGALRYLKGIDVIAKLVPDLLKRHKDISIVLAGDNRVIKETKYGDIYGDEYIRKCAGTEADRVIYLGLLPRMKLYPIVSNALVCLLPSRIENLSNACIEAMAMGKIVVATRGASFEQLIENGKSGFLCKKDDPKSFLTGIEMALSLSDDGRDYISRNAKKRIEYMNPQNSYNIFLEYYLEVIQGWNYNGE